MSSLKQKGTTLFLLILVYVWFSFSHLPNSVQPKPNVLGAENNVSLFIQPDAGRTPILDAINNARHEILTEVYLLSDKDIISSLCRARGRGLAVNVILEQHPFGGGNLNTKTKENLTNCDIAVNWASPAFALTHEKVIVIDNEMAFVLNQNLTASAFSKNREYNILDTNPKDISELRLLFVDDWQRKTFSPATSHLIISPTNSRAAITELINNSTKGLDLEIEDIDDNQITSLLIEKSKSERIRVIVPTVKQISSNASAIKKLAEAGISIKTLSSPYVHAKLIIADSKAYIGSVNLSSQSMDRNREVGIIISENSILYSLFATFESDWKKASDFNRN